MTVDGGQRRTPLTWRQKCRAALASIIHYLRYYYKRSVQEDDPSAWVEHPKEGNRDRQQHIAENRWFPSLVTVKQSISISQWPGAWHNASTRACQNCHKWTTDVVSPKGNPSLDFLTHASITGTQMLLLRAREKENKEFPEWMRDAKAVTHSWGLRKQTALSPHPSYLSYR